MPLGDYQTRLAALLRDSAGEISDKQRDTALLDAVRAYSRYRPHLKVTDVAGEGSRLIALPPDFDPDISKIQSLEYPIGALPPALIPRHDIYHSPDAVKIVLPVTVMATEQVRVAYTACHRVDGARDTVSVGDMAAVCQYAAGALFDQLAALHAGDQDATIASDSVDHQSRADVYRRQAASSRKGFYRHLGVNPDSTPPAGVVVDLDLPGSRGADRLTHTNRHR